MKPFDFNLEVQALRMAIRFSSHQRFISKKQVLGLIILVEQGLKDKSRETRLAVMNYLIGDEIRDALYVRFQSFKNMSGECATILIEYLKKPGDEWSLSENGKRLIACAEDRIKGISV